MDRFDVVVVGAGLSGLRMAGLLSREGLSVLVADRKVDPTRGVHTTGIFVRRTLESFPLPETCLGPPIRQVTMFSPSGRRAIHRSRHDEFRIGRMTALYERELEAATAAGACWAAGHAFEGIDCLHRDTLVELRPQSGRARIIRARFLVGADGTFSDTARALRLDRNEKWLVATELVFPGLALDCEPQLMCFLDPHLAPGYIGWVAHDGCETHVGVGGLAGRFEPGQTLGPFLRKAAAILARDGVLGDTTAFARAEAERRGGCIPIGGMLRRVAGTRGLLVGDAAGAPSPLTAGGLDPCFRLTAVAAEAIVDHLVRDDQTLLATYSGARFRPRFTSRLLMRRLLTSLENPLVVEAVCLSLRLSPGSSIARAVLFGAHSFPGDTDEAQAASGFSQPPMRELSRARDSPLI
jgi:flavin-dependent dehydrogenase